MAEKEFTSGIKATGEDAWVTAQSSARIRATGDFHTMGIHTNANILDEDAELTLDINSTTMTAARAEARQVAEKHAHIKGDAAREKAITTDLIEIRVKYYGEGDPGNRNSAEHQHKKDNKGWFGGIGDESLDIEKIPKGEMKCRHTAPIMSVLLDEAGLPNQVVTSGMNGPNTHGAHAYIVLESGNIVESTTSAKHADQAYLTVVNDVSVDDVIYRGGVMVTHDGYGFGGELEQNFAQRSAIRETIRFDLGKYEKRQAAPQPKVETATATPPTVAPVAPPPVTPPPPTMAAPTEPTMASMPTAEQAKESLRTNLERQEEQATAQHPVEPETAPIPAEQARERLRERLQRNLERQEEQAMAQRATEPTTAFAPTTAQPQTQTPKSAGEMLKGMDKNGDNVVSAQEFNASGVNMQALTSALDADKDGKVTRKEMNVALKDSGLNVNDKRVGGMANAIASLGDMMKSSGVQFSGAVAVVPTSSQATPGQGQGSGKGIG